MGRLMIYSIIWNIYIYILYIYIYIYIYHEPFHLSSHSLPVYAECLALSIWNSRFEQGLCHHVIPGPRSRLRGSLRVLPQTFHGNSHKSINLTLWKMAIDMNYLQIYTGWWYTYPSEKYESQLRWLFPIYRKRKNVPNHQPDIDDTPTQVFSSGNS